MIRSVLRALISLALVASLVAGAPVAQAATPAGEEYVFDGPSAGEDQGSGSSGGGASATESGDSSDSGAGVLILVGVLGLTAAAGAGIAILRRQRT